MLEAVEGNIHQRLCALLDEHRARYRVMAHEAVGQCEAVSAIRGTALGQGAKALVCKVKANDGVDLRVFAGEIHAILGENGSGKSTLMNILSGLYAPDAGEIRMDGQPISIRSPKDAMDKGIGMIHQHFKLVEALTACVFGAIPPFSFHPALRLVADPLLFERFPQIAFNAGRLDRSIILDTEDYLHIARPEIATFRRLS